MADLANGSVSDPWPELARFDPAGGTWVRLTSFNDEIVDGVEFPDVRTIRWTSADGLGIEGRLLTPAGATGPLPMLALVHGGPTWCWNAVFSDSEPNAVLLAVAGYAVLLPNPRGSTGRGHAFASELVVYPREGHLPVERAHLLDALQQTQAWFDRHLMIGGVAT